MKTVLSLGLWIIGAGLLPLAYAQSSFELRNYGLPGWLDAPVFDAEGRPLEGPVHVAELWGGATTDSLRPALDDSIDPRRVIIPFRTGDRAGYFRTGWQVIVSVPIPGGYAWLQVRAWDSRLGATYEEAVARGLGGYGGSPLFYAYGGRPGTLDVPEPLYGLQSFRLLPVIPEPSTWALLALGGLAVAWRLRKRSFGGRRFGSAQLRARQTRGVACGFEALRPGQRRGVGREV